MDNNICYLCKGRTGYLFKKNSRIYVKCNSCGLIYDESPLNETGLSEYYNVRHFKRWEELSRSEFKRLMKKMEYRVEIIKHHCKSGKRLLDIGCERGDFFREGHAVLV